MDTLWSEYEKAVVRKQLSYTVTGNKASIIEKLQAVVDETQADELIVSGQIYNHQARLRSFRILAEAVSLT